MNHRLNNLLDQALALALLDRLHDVDEPTAARAWADEIRQRKSDLLSGVAGAVPWAEARARLNAL